MKIEQPTPTPMHEDVMRRICVIIEQRTPTPTPEDRMQKGSVGELRARVEILLRSMTSFDFLGNDGESAKTASRMKSSTPNCTGRESWNWSDSTRLQSCRLYDRLWRLRKNSGTSLIVNANRACVRCAPATCAKWTYRRVRWTTSPTKACYESMAARQMVFLEMDGRRGRTTACNLLLSMRMAWRKCANDA